MSPRAAAAAVARGAAATVHAPSRTRAPRRPAPVRRRSGASAAPRTAVRTLPRADFVSLLDRVLRGPAYIAVVGLLLAGIVFFNVDVLELNHGIATTDTRTSLLKRENAALTLKLANLGSSERIQRVALQNGLVLPQPGDVRYLRASREDAARALRVMTAPDSSSVAAASPATTTLVTQQSTPAPTSATTPATTTAATQPTATPQPAAATQPTSTQTHTQTAEPTTQQATPPAQATTTPATQAGATAAPTTTTP